MQRRAEKPSVERACLFCSAVQMGSLAGMAHQRGRGQVRQERGREEAPSGCGVWAPPGGG